MRRDMGMDMGCMFCVWTLRSWVVVWGISNNVQLRGAVNAEGEGRESSNE